MTSNILLALRSFLWTVLMPGIVAAYVPWRFLGLSSVRLDRSDGVGMAALALMAAGAFLLAACIIDFARAGRGTLSPVDPPRRLVVRGLYRYVRNPMYLSVTMILLGEAMLTRSTAIVSYWLVFFVLANLFVIGFEEPYLRDRFGASYDDYTRTVGRWIPTLGHHRSARPMAGDQR